MDRYWSNDTENSFFFSMMCTEKYNYLWDVLVFKVKAKSAYAWNIPRLLDSYLLPPLNSISRKKWKEKLQHIKQFVLEVFTNVAESYFEFHVIVISVTGFEVTHNSVIEPFCYFISCKTLNN